VRVRGAHARRGSEIAPEIAPEIVPETASEIELT